MSPNNPPSAAILSVSGVRLLPDERQFLAAANPFGLILFARNVETPEQVSALVQDFRSAVGRADAPVLIDQEGGRVQRLRPPHWPALAAPGAIARLYERDTAAASQAARLLGEAIAATVAPLGIDVACAPMADVRAPGSEDKVIGDRAYGATPEQVSLLAAKTEQALRAAGIATTPKHAPGHGRATIDSHVSLPRVEADMAALQADLGPFKAMTDAPMWMTAHIVYPAIDGGRPATCSPDVLGWLREETGYRGLIVSDDLAMRALEGPIEARAAAARMAGCDLLLYCPGDPVGNAEAIAGAGPADATTIDAWARWTNARAAPSAKDPFALGAELAALLGSDIT